MKRKSFTAFLAVILFVLLCVSCKSTPQPEAEQPQQPTAAPAAPAAPPPAGVNQALVAALNQAVAGADEARKRVMDFEGPAYFPSDWEAVEGQYRAAGGLPKTTDAELQQAASTYNALAGSYNSLFEKTIPLYAQAREDEIIAARDAVIATGLVPDFPEYLPKADAAALDAQSRYEAKDYYGARDTAAKALAEYQTLKAGADAYLVRQEILDRGFVSYDPDNFGKADEIGMNALNAYNAGDMQAAQDGGEEAQLRYNLALASGWAGYAADRRKLAMAEREKALNLKANIAVREAFSDAEAIFTQAETGFKDEKFEDASILYTDSEARFIIVWQEAAEKRRIAEDTIKEAEDKIEASDETAKQAEVIIGGSL